MFELQKIANIDEIPLTFNVHFNQTKTESTKKLLKDITIKMAVILGGVTNQLRPLNVLINYLKIL